MRHLRNYLLELVTSSGRTLAPYEQMLADQVEVIVFVRIPQIPSSRAFGEAPAVSTWEYNARIPDDPAMAQIVPVPPRPFPPELRDPDLLPAPWPPADYATVGWSILTLGLFPLLLWVRSRRRR